MCSFILVYYTAIRLYIDTHDYPPTDARGEVALMLLPVMLSPCQCGRIKESLH